MSPLNHHSTRRTARCNNNGLYCARCRCCWCYGGRWRRSWVLVLHQEARGMFYLRGGSFIVIITIYLKSLLEYIVLFSCLSATMRGVGIDRLTYDLVLYF